MSRARNPWVEPLAHTGKPDCARCAVEMGEAAGRALREARAKAIRMGLARGAHVLGQHPVADFSNDAADRAEAAFPRCYETGRDGAPLAAGVTSEAPAGRKSRPSAKRVKGARS